MLGIVVLVGSGRGRWMFVELPSVEVAVGPVVLVAMGVAIVEVAVVVVATVIAGVVAGIAGVSVVAEAAGFVEIVVDGFASAITETVMFRLVHGSVDIVQAQPAEGNVIDADKGIAGRLDKTADSFPVVGMRETTEAVAGIAALDPVVVEEIVEPVEPVAPRVAAASDPVASFDVEFDAEIVENAASEAAAPTQIAEVIVSAVVEGEVVGVDMMEALSLQVLGFADAICLVLNLVDRLCLQD